VSAFLVDEMFPPSAAVLLREKYGHDAVHVAERDLVLLFVLKQNLSAGRSAGRGPGPVDPRAFRPLPWPALAACVASQRAARPIANRCGSAGRANDAVSDARYGLDNGWCSELPAESAHGD
jgi:hypothetical protein